MHSSLQDLYIMTLSTTLDELVGAFPNLHYEKKLTKNIRPTDILQIYTSI